MYSSGGVSDAYGASGEVTEGNQREVIAFEGPQKMYILWLGRASVTVEMYFPRIKENVSSCILYPLLSIIQTAEQL